MTTAAKCHVILSYLDSPLKILFWTKGEILMVLGPFFVSVFLDAFLFGITASFINVIVIKNYKKRFGSEPEAYAAGESYFPDDMDTPSFYRPTPRGLEARIGEKLAELRALNQAAKKAR